MICVEGLEYLMSEQLVIMSAWSLMYYCLAIKMSFSASFEKVKSIYCFDLLEVYLLLLLFNEDNNLKNTSLFAYYFIFYIVLLKSPWIIIVPLGFSFMKWLNYITVAFFVFSFVSCSWIFGFKYNPITRILLIERLLSST